MPATVLSLLSGYLPAAEAAAVTSDLESQVTADGYGTARTSAGFVSAARYVNGQLSVRLTLAGDTAMPDTTDVYDAQDQADAEAYATARQLLDS